MTSNSKAVSKRLIIIGSLLVVVVVSVAFLGHNYLLKSSCEGIFQQTQLNLSSSIEALQMKGEIGFSSEKIQDLTEKAQLVALNFKACCVAADNGLMPENKFLECKQSTGAFESKMAQAAQLIRKAREVKDDGASQAAEKITGEAEETIRESEDVIADMPKSALSVQPAGPTENTVEVEQEPNSDLFQATPTTLTSVISGELATSEDVDAFVIKNGSSLRDWVSVNLENGSQKLPPEMEIFDGNRRSISEKYETTRGANLKMWFVAEAGEDYYVIVRSWNRGGEGPYKLAISPSKYFDDFEPNDGASQATPISLGQTIKATILDDKDEDWFRLKTPGTGKRKIYLENIEGKLKPQITVFDTNKSKVFERYDTTEGANLDFSVEVPSSDFYVRVNPWLGGWGRYSLIVE